LPKGGKTVAKKKVLLHCFWEYRGMKWPMSLAVEAESIQVIYTAMDWLLSNNIRPAYDIHPPAGGEKMPQAVAYASKLPKEQVCPVHGCSMVKGKFQAKGLVDTHYCPKAVAENVDGQGKTEYCKVQVGLDSNGILRWVGVTVP
jgi:hypothetical protein